MQMQIDEQLTENKNPLHRTLHNRRDPIRLNRDKTEAS